MCAWQLHGQHGPGCCVRMAAVRAAWARLLCAHGSCAGIICLAAVCAWQLCGQHGPGRCVRSMCLAAVGTWQLCGQHARACSFECSMGLAAAHGSCACMQPPRMHSPACGCHVCAMQAHAAACVPPCSRLSSTHAAALTPRHSLTAPRCVTRAQAASFRLSSEKIFTPLVTLSILIQQHPMFADVEASFFPAARQLLANVRRGSARSPTAGLGQLRAALNCALRSKRFERPLLQAAQHNPTQQHTQVNANGVVIQELQVSPLGIIKLIYPKNEDTDARIGIDVFQQVRVCYNITSLCCGVSRVPCEQARMFC